MANGIHLSENDLLLFMDRELAPPARSAAEKHLFTCHDCAQRLQSLQNGSEAYRQYREQVLNPALQVPAAPVTEPRASASGFASSNMPIWWAAAAVFACALIIASMHWASMHWLQQREPTAQQLLTRASVIHQSPQASLLFTSAKYRFSRPAVWRGTDLEPSLRHVHALFAEANYSWDNPLSARSFAGWRLQLRHKKDAVTTIREPDGRQFFQVRTTTDTGILSSAALTLRADTYRATRADFNFQNEDPITLSEQAESPRNGPQQVKAPAPPPQPKPVETPATPEDELRVFAVLNAIGADAEEPLEVALDSDHLHVVVTGLGLSSARRKQVETALATLPKTVLHFRSSQPAESQTPLQPGNAVGPQEASETLKKLQDMAGGIRQLQTITDNAIDTSNRLFAHAHALRVLAQEFPPKVESELNVANAGTLLTLRQRQVGAMTYALRQLREQLQPLLAADPDAAGDNGTVVNWQNGAENLYDATRNLDQQVSRLLSGSYSEQAGEQMLKQLPVELSRTEALLSTQ
jgi:hypothetical protein